jgi:glycosyltransferase involved in cell wall biosynthesis
MRAAIFNPYLDTMGGGERYSLSFARVLADTGWTVDIGWSNLGISQKLEERLGIDLTGINFIPDIHKGSGYDLCFWVSDGSIPLLSARRNLLHFQVPFHEVEGKSLLNRMKLFRINKIICNSNFTKGVVDREYGVNSAVVYPPIDTAKFKPRGKDDLILYVGRFSQLVQSKNQDFLVKHFKKMYDKFGLKGWSLVLAGGIDVGVGDYLENLEKLSRTYPIKIIKNPNFKELTDLYGRAKIFWSAAGFGVNEKCEPEKAEHFGITTVEAMAAGAVPLVFGAGGQKEIIKNEVNGFLWEKPEELINQTVALIGDRKTLSRLSASAVARSKDFSYAQFQKEILKLL